MLHSENNWQAEMQVYFRLLAREISRPQLKQRLEVRKRVLGRGTTNDVNGRAINRQENEGKEISRMDGKVRKDKVISTLPY